MRILIVDDDVITVEAIILHLEIQKHTVEYTGSTDDAIERLRYNAFDCIFLDVMLPTGHCFSLEETADGRYTGLRVVERIRTAAEFVDLRDVKVVLISNWREEPQVTAVAEKHRCKLLRKPLSLSDIDGVMR